MFLYFVEMLPITICSMVSNFACVVFGNDPDLFE